MSEQIFTQFGFDPITLFQHWLNEAKETEINDPEAICIATANAQGHPSARMVLLKDADKNGFKFHTNENSAKGQDMSENTHVSFCIYWKSTRKQIRVEGTVTTVPDAESDEYFKTRPRARAIGAWASQQSQGFADQNDLQKSIAYYEEKFKDADQIPRPPQWKGFRITPNSIEFWIGNKDRLHTRFIYRKNNDGDWNAEWLYP